MRFREPISGISGVLGVRQWSVLQPGSRARGFWKERKCMLVSRRCCAGSESFVTGLSNFTEEIRSSSMYVLCRIKQHTYDMILIIITADHRYQTASFPPQAHLVTEKVRRQAIFNI